MAIPSGFKVVSNWLGVARLDDNGFEFYTDGRGNFITQSGLPADKNGKPTGHLPANFVQKPNPFVQQSQQKPVVNVENTHQKPVAEPGDWWFWGKKSHVIDNHVPQLTSEPQKNLPAAKTGLLKSGEEKKNNNNALTQQPVAQDNTEGKALNHFRKDGSQVRSNHSDAWRYDVKIAQTMGLNPISNDWGAITRKGNDRQLVFPEGTIFPEIHNSIQGLAHSTKNVMELTDRYTQNSGDYFKRLNNLDDLAGDTRCLDRDMNSKKRKADWAREQAGHINKNYQRVEQEYNALAAQLNNKTLLGDANEIKNKMAILERQAQSMVGGMREKEITVQNNTMIVGVQKQLSNYSHALLDKVEKWRADQPIPTHEIEAMYRDLSGHHRQNMLDAVAKHNKKFLGVAILLTVSIGLYCFNAWNNKPKEEWV